MAVIKTCCVLTLALILNVCLSQTNLPDIEIDVFKPRGIRVSIPDVENMSAFTFYGHILAPKDREKATVSTFGVVKQATNGTWIYEDPNWELQPGDVFNYSYIVSINKMDYGNYSLNYTVTEQNRKINYKKISRKCRPTVTRVRGRKVCGGQLIFEDDFKEFNESQWQIEQYIPTNGPDYPFVSYQQSMVETTNGSLNIWADLQQNMTGFETVSIYSGALNLLKGCTESRDFCFKQAFGADILPPVVTGRITSKSFAFTYGTVEVRAKLPMGDWLYPEILLEPLLKKYGSRNYASGAIKIAAARGNRDLFTSFGRVVFDNTILYGGPIMDTKCRNTLLKNKVGNGTWSSNFHTYGVRWAPDRITLTVDGQEWARVAPGLNPLHNQLKNCNISNARLNTGSKMAPFDDHFYITLGLAAGGISEFPDGVNTFGGRPKPWRNQDHKAMLTFWQDWDAWVTTWRRPVLVVDYLKVISL